MASVCDKCGAEVETGAVFCGQCSAPQIRVSLTPAAPTPAAVQSAAATSGQRVRWNQAFPQALGVAAIAALLCVAPITQLFFFLWMALAGMMAVSRYSTRTQCAVSARAGLAMGMVTGILGGFFYALIFAVEMVYTPLGGAFRSEIQRVAGTLPATADPQQAEQLRHLLLSPEGFGIMLAAVGAIMLFLFLLLASVGGVIGAYRSRRPQP